MVIQTNLEQMLMYTKYESKIIAQKNSDASSQTFNGNVVRINKLNGYNLYYELAKRKVIEMEDKPTFKKMKSLNAKVLDLI